MPNSVLRCDQCGRRIFATTFWSHVKKSAGCWLWTAQLVKGYGRQCHTPANRLAWGFTHDHPGAKHVLHKCDNPACVNPWHLYLGTHLDNMADRQRRGRTRNGVTRGEDQAHAVLTDELVRRIRTLHGPPRGRGVRGKPTSFEVAQQLGVPRVLVADVVTGRSWGHVK